MEIRLNELVLPIPKDKNKQSEIIKNIEDVISYRIKAKELARKTILEVTQDNDESVGEYDFLTMMK